MQRKLSLLFVLTIIFFTSCKKQQTPNPTSSLESKKLSVQSTDPISIQNGRLTFATKAAFDGLMASALTDSSVINKKIASISHTNFVAYESKYGSQSNNVAIAKASPLSVQSIIISTTPPASPVTKPIPPAVSIAPTEIDQDDLIEDPLLNKVVNTNGEVQIENTIYKITHNGTFAVPPSYIATLNSMLDSQGILLSQYQNVLTTVDAANGVYKVNDNLYLMDTYGVYSTLDSISNGTNPLIQATGNKKVDKLAPPVDPCTDPNGCPTGGDTPPPVAVNPPVSTNPYGNMDIYPFNSRYTKVGKIIQTLFGNPHYKYYKTDANRRLKVNFYAENWFFYASTGVRAVIQKKSSFLGITFWGPVENKDEMRLGWTPLVIASDFQFTVTNPGTPTPQNPYDVAAAITQHEFSSLIGNDSYFTLAVSDVLNANATFSFLPSGWAAKLNSFSFDVNAAIKGAANPEIKQFFTLIQTKAKYVPATNKLAFINNDQIMIDGGEIVHSSSQGNGAMSKTFNFDTAFIGYTTNPNTGSSTWKLTKLARTIKVFHGGTYALGKLNGEWVGIGVTQK